MILLFISGVIAAALAGVAEILVTPALSPFGGMEATAWDPGTARTGAFIAGLFLLALIEEALKLAVLHRQLLRIPDLRPLLPSIAFGLGFAGAEISLLAAWTPTGILPAIPLLGIAAVHLLTSVAYGLIPTTAPRTSLLLALIIGTGAHAFYNMFLALA